MGFKREEVDMKRCTALDQPFSCRRRPAGGDSIVSEEIPYAAAAVAICIYRLSCSTFAEI